VRNLYKFQYGIIIMTYGVGIIDTFEEAQELEALLYKVNYAPSAALNLYAIKQTRILPNKNELQERLSSLKKEYCNLMQGLIEDAKYPQKESQEIMDDCDNKELEAIIRGARLVLENFEVLWGYYTQCAGKKKGKKAVKTSLKMDMDYAQKCLDALAEEIS